MPATGPAARGPGARVGSDRGGADEGDRTSHVNAAMSICRYIASLPSRIITGDFAASFWGPARPPPPRTRPPAPPSFTMPASRASSAVSRSPAAAARWSSCAARCGRSAPSYHEREHPHVDLGRAEPRALLGHDQVARPPERAASTCPLAAQMLGLPESADRLNRAGSARAEVLVHEGTSRRTGPGCRPARKTFSCEEVRTTSAPVVAAGRLRGVHGRSAARWSARAASGESSVTSNAMPLGGPRS